MSFNIMCRNVSTKLFQFTTLTLNCRGVVRWFKSHNILRSRILKNEVLNNHCCCRRISQSSELQQSTSSRKFVLGIETSCDDTAAAVVDNYGNVIGEALHSQTKVHNKTGGIIPNVAKELHRKCIAQVVSQALNDAKMPINNMDAIAVTVKPGLIMSLRIGMRHAARLAQLTQKQLIPIHHMEAHALTVRMIHKVEFPFLVMLMSGGHGLLAVARDIDDFIILGSSMDSAPGDAFDKTARELKLWSLPDFYGVSGGAAVEEMAKQGDHTAFPMKYVAMRSASCNFSFVGVTALAKQRIQAEYKRLDWPKDEVLPNTADICAWFQYCITYHIARRLQRAFLFCEMNQLLGEQKTLVLSGGVASNGYMRACLEHVCADYNCQLICPPVKLCTDNGVMIAWNGIEKLMSGRSFSQDPDTVDVCAKSPLGPDYTDQVSNSYFKLPKLNLRGS